MSATLALISLDVPVYDPRGNTRFTHIEWSRVVARGVRERYHFGQGSQEEQDLEQVAALTLARKVAGFDASRVPPGGNTDLAFRGWVKLSVMSECQREADRLRNVGLYLTARPEARASLRVGGDVPEDLSPRTHRESTGALVEIGDVVCRMYDGELSVENEPDLDAWAQAVGVLEMQRERTLWALGDLIQYGEQAFGDADAWDKLGALGYATKTLSKACALSKKYPPEIRISGASWSHHRVVLSLPLARAVSLLQRAVRERLSVAVLKNIVGRRKARKSNREPHTRLERERAPLIASRCDLTVKQVLAVLKAFREFKPASE